MGRRTEDKNGMRKSKMTLKFLAKVMGLFLFQLVALVLKSTNVRQQLKMVFVSVLIRGWKYSDGFFFGGWGGNYEVG